MRRHFSLTLLFLFSIQQHAHGASLKVGDKPDSVTLSGDSGGKLDGSAWSSEELKGKSFLLMYVDPDVKGDNEAVEDKLKAQGFPHDTYGSFAIINMAATWVPNGMIDSRLKAKQEKFIYTTYVKDLKKSLVKTWGLADDSYNVLYFTKDGKLAWRKDGKLSDAEVADLIATIRKNL